MLGKSLKFLFTQEVVFTGIQPTGSLHIGNYLGSIKNILKLQDSAHKLYLCVVDYHALTNKFTKDHSDLRYSANLATETLEMFSALLACGVDPDKTRLFLQSDVPQHAELSWILGCIAPHHWLNSMIQYKEKKQKNSNPSLGLYSYPILMAADIILYGATKVPVGSDQVQHLQLTQKVVSRFNSIFGNVLVEPQYIPSNAPRVMSLLDASKKMSKSNSKDMSRINLTDSRDHIFSKINKAKTDSIVGIYTQQGRHQINNLISMYASFQDKPLDEVNAQLSGKTIQQFKYILSTSVANTLDPIRQKLDWYRGNPEQVRRVMRESKVRVGHQAEQRMNELKRVMGMYV